MQSRSVRPLPLLPSAPLRSGGSNGFRESTTAMGVPMRSLSPALRLMQRSLTTTPVGSAVPSTPRGEMTGLTYSSSVPSAPLSSRQPCVISPGLTSATTPGSPLHSQPYIASCREPNVTAAVGRRPRANSLGPSAITSKSSTPELPRLFPEARQSSWGRRSSQMAYSTPEEEDLLSAADALLSGKTKASFGEASRTPSSAREKRGLNCCDTKEPLSGSLTDALCDMWNSEPVPLRSPPTAGEVYHSSPPAAAQSAQGVRNSLDSTDGFGKESSSPGLIDALDMLVATSTEWREGNRSSTPRGPSKIGESQPASSFPPSIGIRGIGGPAHSSSSVAFDTAFNDLSPLPSDVDGFSFVDAEDASPGVYCQPLPTLMSICLPGSPKRTSREPVPSFDQTDASIVCIDEFGRLQKARAQVRDRPCVVRFECHSSSCPSEPPRQPERPQTKAGCATSRPRGCVSAAFSGGA
eukprot:TRINITY_DN62315_c0_g1_i1.p1 TRINITY_DN62315_c0_g1~~TRINITY_DN62315_c0_g1_i1.p1  ORF type:complete len:466 (-),score=42.09 TRINITY_DN62315_c0_g1_i1:136-1533(-)